jgi:hypothetical protein
LRKRLSLPHDALGMTVLSVIAIVLAQALLPALATYFLVRRRTTLPADQLAALSLAFAPVLVCIGVMAAGGIGWRLGGQVAIAFILGTVIVALGPLRAGAAEFLRQPVTRLWAWAALFWLAQEMMIFCHGRAHYTWDWAHHFNLARGMVGTISQGYPPVMLGRTALIGVWSVPALIVAPEFWTFQITALVANATVMLAAYLWGARLSGSARGGGLALAVTLLCPGLAQNAIYTWPKVFAAALHLLAFYFFATSQDRHRLAPRAGWEAAAGTTLAAAFQAHSSTGLYAVAFFALVAARFALRPRRYPWIMLTTFAALMGLYLAGMAYRFGVEAIWGGNPYFVAGEMAAGKQWALLQEHLRTTLIPVNLWHEFGRYGWSSYWSGWLADLQRQDNLLRATTDILLPTLPLVATGALTWVPLRRLARRGPQTSLPPDSTDVVVGTSLLLGAFLTLLFLEPAGLGAVQTALTPLLVFALALAGALCVHIGAVGAAILWTTSLLQYVLFRGALLALNVDPRGADGANWVIKANEKIRHFVELDEVMLPVATVIALVSMSVLIVRVRQTVRRGGQRTSGH